jgi:hypothetical protein
MRRLSAIFTAIAIVASLSLAGFAAEKTFSGEITDISVTAQIFKVRSSEGTVKEFHAEPSSQFLINGDVKLFSELRKGDHVSITYDENVHVPKKVTKSTKAMKDL